MIRPARASNPYSPIIVARQRVPRRYQQRHRGRPHMAVVEFQICSNVLSFIKIGRFLSRVSILTRDIDIANLSVCSSVCRSVCSSVRNVPVSDENGLTHRHSFFYHTVAQSFCFHQHQTSSRNSDGVTPCGCAKYRRGIKISRFSTNNSLYLANDAR